MKATFYFVLLFLACLLATTIVKTKTPKKAQSFSLEPIARIAGQIPNAASKGVSKVATLANIDEAELGKKLKEQLQRETFSEKNEYKRIYLQSLLDYISKFKKKNFGYSVFILDNEGPNAMALPGGVILVTIGLIDTLKSEAEMIAVLAHEMGHIENSHCLNSVKYELLTKKIELDQLGSQLDILRNILLRKTFSRLEEEEADQYSFETLLMSLYDPSSLSHSLGRLKNQISNDSRNIVFGTHPSIDSRFNKYKFWSQQWWKTNAGRIRYVGKRNYIQFTSVRQVDFGSEESVTHYNDLENL